MSLRDIKLLRRENNARLRMCARAYNAKNTSLPSAGHEKYLDTRPARPARLQDRCVPVNYTSNSSHRYELGIGRVPKRDFEMELSFSLHGASSLQRGLHLA
jgi:hypothetical protein